MAGSELISLYDKCSTTVDISICIVTFNCSQSLELCLKSLPSSCGLYQLEIIVIDNYSTDNTVELIRNKFCNIKYIQNKSNIGFAAGMNQAIANASGKYIVILNPDTILSGECLSILADFLDNHPNTGICGPKVLNQDGTFQKSCRRGDSSPWAVISYFFMLDKLFPNIPMFNRYHLGHIDDNEQIKIGGLSGSCMMIRYSILDLIGKFDERFFLYQEDSDICLRVLSAGLNIYFVPESTIIHSGGKGGTESNLCRATFEWHLSYFKLYRKHFERDYIFLFNILFYILMFIKFALAFIWLPFKKRL